MATSIGLKVKKVEERLYRAWKLVNPEKVAKLARETSPGILKFYLKGAVNSYLESILDGIKEIAEKVILIAK